MRVLWISMNAGLMGIQAGNTHYNGGGWISSLQHLFLDDKDIDLGLTFLTPSKISPKVERGTSYFPIKSENKGFWTKLKYYYGGFKRPDRELYVKELLQVIENFKPDIIHLFGIENTLARIIGKTDIPIVTHIQGILSPYANAFWPVEFNKYSFLCRLSFNENILRNGYNHAKNTYTYNSILEKKLFHSLKFAMGRTEWDYQMVKLLSPDCRYYHVDEVLRNVFYENKGAWKSSRATKLRIISTISNTVYKGLDLVLKTAALLKENSTMAFEWHIVGLNDKHKMVEIFEEELGIKSKDVNVQYCGILSAEELCKLELQMSIYVHPSYIDNSPNSVCEAQLLGLPVIATNVGGLPSLVNHGRTGFLVPANAPYELAYRIAWMYENPGAVAKIAWEGAKVAELRHDREKIKKDLLNVYKEILN